MPHILKSLFIFAYVVVVKDANTRRITGYVSEWAVDDLFKHLLGVMKTHGFWLGYSTNTRVQNNVQKVIDFQIGRVLWYVNPYRLFNAKSCEYIY